MRQILDRIGSSPLFSDLLEALRTRAEVPLHGAAGSLRSTLVALLYQRTAEPIVMIFEDRADADAVYVDLVTLIGSDHTLLYQEEHHSAATLRDTLDAELVSLSDALKALSDDPLRIVVTDVETFAAPVPPPASITANIVELRVGATMAIEDLTRRLALGGFERAEISESVGQYALRGGIVDVFPAGRDNPLRIEFFGDEIESIREFDPLSQRSVRDVPHVDIMARLFHAEDDELGATLLDHLREEAVLYLEEPERLFGLLEDAGHAGLLPAIERHRRLTHSQFAGGEPGGVEVGGRAQPAFSSSLAELCRGVEQLRDDGYSVHVLADGDEARRRAEELIEGECDRAEEEGTPYSFAPGDLVYDAETLSNGFLLPALKLAIITEHEVFSRKRARARVVRRKQFKGFTLRELKQLRMGDFVVHVDKGIGRFVGLQTITVGGNRVEAVKLEYAGSDTLFVNLNYINRLQKYSSKEGATPKLSRLGTEEWERVKARAKRRVKDIARELIRLYAARKSQPGYQYPPDTAWQRELEASFIYEDTPDQASATWAVKQDMESATPMDRLVCGDVGFGKTEVAIRAAFKAAQAGRQVAILAPTTILAQQHYNSFRDRLHRYAVNVGLLSRFRSKLQQKETLDGLKAGTVDVLIGTHRILSKDVRFKDLGLLIIDEEQRFGVAAKEKLRQMRATVDTLTLTATPIPRTLNFSLMGARDLSLIETPPRNRLPIVTELIKWDEDAIGQAVRTEVRRGGQCFVVHWRVSDITDLAARVATLVPEARVAIIHGEMTSEQIERTMSAFIEHRHDVLVATKIVESGIDIPSVNTIIINRADKFGLAELYQLRGRVGRSNTQAYCYMIVPPPAALSRIALKRLQAIQELTELGSGMKLAMRDLEIRGAGNLLGSEQSGFIEDVGFELYQKIVDEAVEELKKEEFRDLFRDEIEDEERQMALPVNDDIVVEIDGDALIPKAYIADDADRYEFYQRMYAAGDVGRLQSIAYEMRDRFGPVPEETERLFDAVRLRLAGMPTGAVRLSHRGGTLRLELPPDSNQEYYDRWFHAIMAATNRQKFAQVETRGRSLALVFSRVADTDEAVRTLEDFISALREMAAAFAEDRAAQQSSASAD